ncbi:MAG: hypothetical protein ACFFC7_06660 [Candidatus Hermodarchaeota archaeon]
MPELDTFVPILGVPLGMGLCLYFIPEPSWLECAIWSFFAIGILTYLRLTVLRILQPPFRMTKPITRVHLRKTPGEGLYITRPEPAYAFYFEVKQQPQASVQNFRNLAHRGVLLVQRSEGSFLGFITKENSPLSPFLSEMQPEAVIERAREFKSQAEVQCPGLKIESKLLRPLATIMPKKNSLFDETTIQNLGLTTSQSNSIKKEKRSERRTELIEEIYFPEAQMDVSKGSFSTSRSPTLVSPHSMVENKPKKPLVIVDGNNVAYDEKDQQGRPKLWNILVMKEELETQGFDVIIFVSAALRYNIDEKEMFESLINDQTITQVPAGTYDDKFVINAAKKRTGFILSNDKFEEFPAEQNWIKKRQIKFKISEGVVLFENEILSIEEN